MRRTNWKTVSTLVTMLALAGCSEQVIAPAPSSSTASIQLAPGSRPALSLNVAAVPNGSSDFTVGPAGGVFFIGSNAVIFPRNSICDPAVSSYGFGTWDDACTPLASNIRIHAETRVADGRSWIDFTPSLRFVPSNDPARWVWMYMSTPSAIGVTSLDRYTIYYTPTIGGPLYDESRDDPTLRTYVDSRTGVSIRRIKHFSGYTVNGERCDTPDGVTCFDGGGGEEATNH